MLTSVRHAWTFVLTGEVRSGAGVVLSSINNRVGAKCHADLFHADQGVRRAAHEAYFGVSTGKTPEWLADGITNPFHYLSRVALDPRNGECSVGAYVPHAAVRRLELYDLFEEKAREGGFSVIQVVRNPVACFVSWKQAQQCGVWTRRQRSAADRPPLPIRIDPDELTLFCREYVATQAKVRATCRDRLDIEYRDLVLDYQGTMQAVFDHIELPDEPVLAHADTKRLRNRTVKNRVTNWTELRLDVPGDVRSAMDAEDLF